MIMVESGSKWMGGVKWLLLAGFFLAALGGSAWLGVSLAKKNLPDWVGEKVEVLKGDEIVIGAEEQMIYLAEKNQHIKDFFYKYSKERDRLEADADKANVRRLSAQVKIRVKRRDAGTVSVEVLSGPLNGEVFWMPVSQLKLKQKSEDLPLIKGERVKK